MKSNRNWIVFTVSIIYLIIIFITLFYTFTGNLPKTIGKVTPQWYNYYIYITAVIYIIGFFFIFKMKRWALILLTGITVILYLSALFTGIFNIYSLIIDIIVFGILWTQYKKMK